MKPNLQLIHDEEPTAAAIMQARIEQGWREYRSPSGDISNPHGWQPIATGAANPLDVDAVLAPRFVVVDAPLPWWRRVLRWVRC